MNINNLNKINYTNILFWIAWPLALLALLILLFFTCSGQKDSNKKQEDTEAVAEQSVEQVPPVFRMVDIPPMLTEPESRATYLVEHYWDHFDFADTMAIHFPEITEQAFADYLSVLPHTNQLIAGNAIHTMLNRTVQEDKTGKVYAYFLEKYESYLGDPNSPMRNEEYYIPVLEHILKNPTSDEASQSRAAFDLQLALKNRVGSKATDFSYTTADKQKGRLYGIQSDYTLVYFYDPDCPACKESAAYLEASPLVAQLLKNKKLSILAIYPDEDISLWKAHQESLPSSWIRGYDESQVLKNKLLYDLKATPTLYLLDRDKQVLLKDATAEQIALYLDQQINN